MKIENNINESQTDSIFLSKLHILIKTYEEVDTMVMSNGERISNVDNELNDWYKFLQEKELTDKEFTAVAKKIKELQNKRATLRKEFALENFFKQNVKSLDNYNDRKKIVDELKKLIDKINQPTNYKIINDGTICGLLKTKEQFSEESQNM